MSSCNITKFLSEDELIVDEVTTRIKSDEKPSEIASLKDELEKFYILTPNKNFRSRNYYQYKDLENPSWIKRWLKNKHSEKPSILDTNLIAKSELNIQNYLRNKKGFYQAEVTHEVKNSPSSKLAKIVYRVNTGARYSVNKIYHISRDSSLTTLLDTIARKSIIKDNDPIDAFSFDIEKQRIVSEFQKHGYADFNLTNVEIKGDSTDLTNSWDIFYMILPPAGATSHQNFSVGDIYVYTDSHNNQKEDQLKTEYLFGKYYKHQSKKFIVRPSTIDRKIYLQKYDTYDSENYYKTIRSLFSLGSYRFAKLSPRVNPKDSTLIDYNIFLTPQGSKWALDTGLEAFYSNISVLNNNLVGIASSFGIEDRNAFGGSERFKTSLEAGVEINPANAQINTLALGLNNRLEIPTLTKPLNVLRPFKKLGIIRKEKFQVLQDVGKSNLSLGFNYLDNLNLYKIFSVEAGYGYDFLINSKKRITFNQMGLNYTSYDIVNGGPFEQILDSNPVLQNSFQSNLFTGFLFNDLTYFFQTERGKNKANIALISRLELSGLEVFAANSLYNSVFNKSSRWTIGNIDFERLAKLEFDFRWYQRARERSQLAARIKTGIAVPLDKDRTVSYVKQFSVGGPSSIRAWRPMHLGPGRYLHEGDEFFSPPDSTIFYQRGDIILDMSLEYRFDLIWLVEGALFVDAGNIWTIKEDSLRPGSRFDLEFLSNLAIGYGYGLRFDFNYFIIRFDLGFKLKYPSALQPYVNSSWRGPKGQKFGNFNIAVNYPF